MILSRKDMYDKTRSRSNETYTGICMLTGDDRRLAYEYAEKLLGHPIYTHEFPKYADELKKLSKPDFIEICRKLGD